MIDVIDFPTQYELTYPIIKTPGPWIVVGVCANHEDDVEEMGKIYYVDIHLDADDPNFEFVDPVDWPEIHEKVINQYNFPYRKAGRLALRRGNVNENKTIMDAHTKAACEIEAWRRSRMGENPVMVTIGNFIFGISR